MLSCGLLGRHLTHSYSPEIHALLYPYSYVLFEKEPEEVQDFLREGQWDGLNVTIPYKKAAYEAMDALGKDASRAKSVNTIIRLPDGKLYGDSTDVYGFKMMVKHSGINVAGKKALVLGSGGAALAVAAALQDLEAGKIIVVSRKAAEAEKGFRHLDCMDAQEDGQKAERLSRTALSFCGYEETEEYRDADVLVNATPVGMYPENGAAPIDLKQFSSLSGVLDLIYNPARTALLLQAETLGIPCENGLYMLVAQAKKSAEIFTGKELDDSLIDRIYAKLSLQLENIALIGMPGVGKTTAAKLICEKTGRTYIDTDEEIRKRCGITPEELIRTVGTDAFRKIETEVLSEVSKLSGAVIATGGGIVTRKENYPLLHQNSRIVWLKRDIAALPTENRPLSKSMSLEKMYEIRKPMYEAFADETVELCGEADILRFLKDIGAAGTKEERR